MVETFKLFDKKDKIIGEIDETIQVSGARIISITQEIQALEQQANKNIKKLFLLL